MYIVRAIMACSRHVSLTISRSLEYPEAGLWNWAVFLVVHCGRLAPAFQMLTVGG